MAQVPASQAQEPGSFLFQLGNDTIVTLLVAGRTKKYPTQAQLQRLMGHLPISQIPYLTGAKAPKSKGPFSARLKPCPDTRLVCGSIRSAQLQFHRAAAADGAVTLGQIGGEPEGNGAG